MASETLLLVIIVREAGLRSTLVARLSLAGADVLTADDFDDPRLARHKRRPLVLVADQAAVDDHRGGCAVLAADPRWRQLVLLSADADAANQNPRLIRVDRATAAGAITHMLPAWQVPAA